MVASGAVVVDRMALVEVAMRIARTLLVLLALASPASAQDGPQDAAAAREAMQAFRVYLEGVAKKGERPDLTRPEVAKLLHRVFDLDALAALPPAQANDVSWLLEWGDTANGTNKLIILFGSKRGTEPDWAAIQRNMTEYEDEWSRARTVSRPMPVWWRPPSATRATSGRAISFRRIGPVS